MLPVKFDNLYTIIATPEFSDENMATALTCGPLFEPVLEAFEASDFLNKTKYESICFHFMIDGYVPGKDDSTVFAHLPSISYREARDALGLGLRITFPVSRNSWLGLNQSDLQLLLTRTLFIMALHVCRTLRLNSRPLLGLLPSMALEQRELLTQAIARMDELTFNCKIQKQVPEIQLHCKLSDELNTDVGRLYLVRLQDQLDELLQSLEYGFVADHFFEGGHLVINIRCYVKPQVVLTKLRGLEEIAELKDSYALLKSNKGIKTLNL